MRRGLLTISLVALAWLTPAGALASGPPSVAYVTVKLSRGSAVCTGVLVAPQRVATAGHCLAGARRVSVALGGSHRPSRKRVAAAGWRASGRVDLGLIDLPSAAADESRQPAPTFSGPQGVHSGEVGKVFGYGAIVLKRFRVPLRRPRLCRESGFEPANQLCAGHRHDRRSPCAGDSGGPMFLRGGAIAVLSGYSARAGECGELPFVYTRLDSETALRFLASPPIAGARWVRRARGPARARP